MKALFESVTGVFFLEINSSVPATPVPCRFGLKNPEYRQNQSFEYSEFLRRNWYTGPVVSGHSMSYLRKICRVFFISVTGTVNFTHQHGGFAGSGPGFT